MNGDVEDRWTVRRIQMKGQDGSRYPSWTVSICSLGKPTQIRMSWISKGNLTGCDAAFKSPHWLKLTLSLKMPNSVCRVEGTVEQLDGDFSQWRGQRLPTQSLAHTCPSANASASSHPKPPNCPLLRETVAISFW